MDQTLRGWLLEEDNPGVRLRALRALNGLAEDDPAVLAARQRVVQTLPAAADVSWMEDKGLILTYSLTALAESGLTRADVAVDAVVDRLLAGSFDAACGDMLLLRALVMLGYGDDVRVQQRLGQVTETQLPDGGWFCLHRLHKMTKTPKSCIKAAMHGLLLAAELHKRGQPMVGSEALLQYFLRRRVFYRTEDPTQLVLNARPGWRMLDAFFPIEVQRVGLPVLLEALAALGASDVPELQEAWALLDAKRDAQGRVKLEGTLAKSYLPKERVGKPSKWATLYACMAWAQRAG